MLNKLMRDAGINSVKKMMRMFTDIETSKGIVTALREQKGCTELGPGITFSVEVLTTGNWPVTQQKFQIPPEIKACESEFETFYAEQHKRRALKWIYHYGTCELHTTFADKEYLLITNLQQAAILCLYNDIDVLTIGEIAEKT